MLDDDYFGRHVTVATADGVDTYTVVDPYYGDYTFMMPFPENTDLMFVYLILSMFYPRNIGGAVTGYQEDFQLDQNAFQTENRPMGVVLGYPSFDLTLGIPIWYVGYGTTGWVNANGDQV